MSWCWAARPRDLVTGEVGGLSVAVEGGRQDRGDPDGRDYHAHSPCSQRHGCFLR